MERKRKQVEPGKAVTPRPTPDEIREIRNAIFFERGQPLSDAEVELQGFITKQTCELAPLAVEMIGRPLTERDEAVMGAAMRLTLRALRLARRSNERAAA